MYYHYVWDSVALQAQYEPTQGSLWTKMTSDYQYGSQSRCWWCLPSFMLTKSELWAVGG